MAGIKSHGPVDGCFASAEPFQPNWFKTENEDDDEDENDLRGQDQDNFCIGVDYKLFTFNAYRSLSSSK